MTRGLGKNLSALLGTEDIVVTEATQATKETLPIDSLVKSAYQPRRRFDEAALADLTASIQNQGVLQPLIVRKLKENTFEILAGERRWRAARRAQLKEVPVIIKEVSDKEALAIALVENLQREDLNVLEEARGMAQLMDDFGLTHQQVAEALGKNSRSHVTNLLRLLTLPELIQDRLEAGQLDMGHARALLPLNTVEQLALADKIIKQDLSVRETEMLVKEMKQGVTHTQAVKQAPVHSAVAERLEGSLNMLLNTAVKIYPKASGKGRLVIQYTSLEEVEGLIDRLSPPSKQSSFA